MKMHALIISSLIILVVMAAGCRSEVSLTSTPVPTVAGAPILAPQVPLLTLVRQPASFADQYIEVTGQYQLLPRLVCGDDTHLSPAGWQLTSGEIAIPVSGFDGSLRRLADTGLSVTVQGRWRFWEGPVGCGRRAPVEQLWYLEATTIVSPNPLVRASEGQTIVVVPTLPAEDDGGIATGPPPVPTATASGSQNGQASQTPASGIPTATLPPPPSTPTIPPVPSATASPTLTNGGVTVTASATPALTTTATATTAPGEGTPTETATATIEGTPAGTPEPADQGVIIFDNVQKKELASGTAHRWAFSAEAGNVVTVSAAASLTLDTRLDILSPNGTVLSGKNELPVGGPETTGALTIAEAGVYQIIVSAVGTGDGFYALVLLESGSEPFYIFRETINYGANRSGSLDQGQDHLWNFTGTVDDVITIRVTPGTGFNVVLYILGPDGSELIYLDDGDEDEDEALVSYSLPESGFYSIAVGERDFREASYTLSLQRE